MPPRQPVSEPPPPAAEKGRIHMLRALGSRNYRLYFGGQGISLVGTWMTRIATSWLIYRLTGSALLLGIVGFAGQIPSFVIGPFAGVLIDRWNRHRLILVMQALAMLQSFALAWLTLAGTITVAQVLWLSAAQGVINAFDMPGRQAFVVEMVERREDLGNAIALNSSLFNMARLVGPSVGGVLIAAVGEGWCFMIDAISYVAVIASLMAMKLGPRKTVESKRGAGLAQLREGFRYAFGSPPIRTIIVLLALVSVLGMPYTVLMPVIAKAVLGGGPAVLGTLMAASGVGALAGAILLASRRSVVGLGRVIPAMTALFGLGLAAFSLSRALWLSVAFLVVIGFGFMVQTAASNTILQTIVEDDKRGRVMSFYTMAFMGMTPFGSLVAGWLADRIGAPETILVSGACCIAAAAWFATTLPRLREVVRPIYLEKGILPAAEPTPTSPV
ncbi:MAG TPA: MFS transporter [Longimicrobiaceae bacterium]|jgi:MFS family permease|nr:MFS transporter [Longimicrobiaceae bacterium]